MQFARNEFKCNLKEILTALNNLKELVAILLKGIAAFDCPSLITH